jgi:hypothetical protein
MEILTTNIKLPIFLTEKNIYLTKKRNLSLSNQSSINTSISPNDNFEPSELFLDNTNNFVNLKSISDESKIIKEPIIKKGKWSQEEDNLLKKYVNKFGEGNWSKIEKFFIGRTRKQIRQRYISNIKIKKISEKNNEKISLDSCSSSDEDEKDEIQNYENKNIFKWDEELDKVLLKEYFLCKKSWVKISKKIPGSSENSVKNRFYSLLRQKVNKIKKEYRYKFINKSITRNYKNKNDIILLIKKEIYGNKINNNLEDKNESLINKLYFESEYCNNKSKKRNYSVEFLLEFLPDLLEDKEIDIYGILSELKQRKNNAAKQIFIIVEKHLDYKNSEIQECNSISTDIEFDNLKNLQSEKLGIVIKNMKLKIMYKYFHRFRYNTLGI